MASFQSPEGSSTINFPELMGRRMAYEVLLMDRPLTAKEAIACGFANGMVEGFDEKEWFDLQKVPAISKLLANDLDTMVRCKSVLNFAKNNEKIEAVLVKEGDELVNAWMDPTFPKKLGSYMMSLMQKRE
jgi:enoyl-CoA hydratase/carnithine racemase